MKIVNKYILASCVFCYFAGIYLLAIKFGIMRFISQYGFSRAFDEWPADFPSLNLVYICLAIYTILFALVTYVIYKYIENHSKETDKLQQGVSILHDYSDSIALIVSHYNRICLEKNVSNKMQIQRLQLLEKQIKSLTASVLDNSSAKSIISRIISDLDDSVMNMESSDDNAAVEKDLQFSNIVERSIEDVQRLRTSSITIK